MDKDYKKLYKQALERARDLHDNHPLGQPQTWTTCEKIFPELKESEDERIRKNCIHFLELQKQHHAATFEIEECISWLEKIIIPSHNDIDSSFIEDIKNVIAEAPLLMQSDKEKMVAWLEKQGDYNRLVEEIKERKELISKEKEKVTSTNDKLSLGGRIAILEELLAFTWNKQVEQKSANKVEPKFKVGDCIRYRGDNYKIKDIETTKHGFIYNVAIIGKPSDLEEVKTAIGIAAEKDMVKIEQPS